MECLPPSEWLGWEAILHPRSESPGSSRGPRRGTLHEEAGMKGEGKVERAGSLGCCNHAERDLCGSSTSHIASAQGMTHAPQCHCDLVPGTCRKRQAALLTTSPQSCLCSWSLLSFPSPAASTTPPPRSSERKTQMSHLLIPLAWGGGFVDFQGCQFSVEW